MGFFMHIYCHYFPVMLMFFYMMNLSLWMLLINMIVKNFLITLWLANWSILRSIFLNLPLLLSANCYSALNQMLWNGEGNVYPNYTFHIMSYISHRDLLIESSLLYLSTLYWRNIQVICDVSSLLSAFSWGMCTSVMTRFKSF